MEKTLNHLNLVNWAEDMDKKKLSAVCVLSLHPNGAIEIHSIIEPEKLIPVLEKTLKALKAVKPVLILK